MLDSFHIPHVLGNLHSKVCPHQDLVEGKCHLPQPSGKASKAAQDTVDLLSLKGFISSSSSCSAKLHLLVRPQQVLLCGIIPPQVQGFLLTLVEMHEAPVSLFLQLAKIPLDGSATPFLLLVWQIFLQIIFLT